MLANTVRSSEQHRNYLLWQEMDLIAGQDAVSAAMISAIEPNLEQSFKTLVDSSPLLPIPGAKATWNDVRKKMPKVSIIGANLSSDVLQSLLILRDKKVFEEQFLVHFPARTKMDLSIRRNRAIDFFLFLKTYDKSSLEYLFQRVLKIGFDYIFVCNIMSAVAVLGIEWIHHMELIDAFAGDVAHYIACSKILNDTIKTRGLEDENWLNYVESATLAGYRNPPFKGFDPVLETKLLAEGGIRHEYYGFDFDELCREELKMEVLPVKFVSFEDFVTEASWLTAGASSVGKLEVQVEEDKVKFIKAKKNTVPDVYDLKDLYEECLNWNKQENYSIVKSELGKIRMAVASDMPMYLQMSWINYLLNGAYNQWPGSTTDETFIDQTKRMGRMLELCSKMLGLPFDYAAFDHQPTTKELQSIVKVILNAARKNVPIQELSKFDRVASNILTSFDHSVLEWRDKENGALFKVEGGLMSGLRFTSLVGNAWNTVMTGLVMKLLTNTGLNTSQIVRFIRGDDSAIYVPNWGLGAMVKLTYDAVKIKAGEGKFSLQARAMEFLRIWYETKCSGYIMRALPGLMQRKPWNPEPWAAEGTIKAVYDVIRILRRRSPLNETRISKVWQHLRARWCMNHSLPVACLRTPKFLGGLAVEGGPGPLYRIVPPIPTGSEFPDWFSVINQNTWRREKLRKYYSERYSVDLSEDDSGRLAKSQLLNTLASDDVPAVSSVLRKTWLETIKTKRHMAVLVKTEPEDQTPPIILNAFPISDPGLLMTTLKERSPLFGALPDLATVVADFHSLRPKISLSAFLRQHFPKGNTLLQQFHKSWYLGERIDYLIGKIPVQSERIHPMLTEVWQRMIAIQMPPNRYLRRLSFVQIAAAEERSVWNSTLSATLYGW